MSKTINIVLDNKSLDSAIKDLRAYARWVEKKENELRTRLAMLGATVASIRFSGAIAPTNDVSVRVDDNGTTATIIAEGKDVVFIEFGTGMKYGYGHPDADKFGYGPGTWSDDPSKGGKGHWDNEHGWWFGSSQHTYGNPPAQAMYSAAKTITEQFTQIAREVFSQ